MGLLRGWRWRCTVNEKEKTKAKTDGVQSDPLKKRAVPGASFLLSIALSKINIHIDDVKKYIYTHILVSGTLFSQISIWISHSMFLAFV